MSAQPIPTLRRSFRSWLSAGFPDIIPVIPPGATLSPSTRIKPESRGKAPGYLGRHGWRSFDWMHAEATEDEVAKWDRDGANVGLRATHFPGLDIDVTDEAIADAIADLADKHLGAAPSRTGKAPKRVMVYRLADGQAPMTRRRLWFKGPDDAKHLVEFLGHGQQYVVDGRHPATGRPYTWDAHPADAGAAALSPVTAGQVDAFFEEVSETLDMLFGCEAFEPEGTGAEARDRASIDQDGHRAPALDKVREALAVAPNPGTTTRTDYLRMGYAIKAALPEDDEAAYALFEDWALRWPGGDDPEVVRADWARMKPPFEVGWSYIRDTAAPHGYDTAGDDFEGDVAEAIDDAEAAVEALIERRAEERQAVEEERRDRYALRPPKQLPEGFDPAKLPKRAWVLGNRFLKGAVTGGVGAPGVNKSTMSILSALAIASGKELTGEKVHVEGAVWVHDNEDDETEMERRMASMCARHGVALGDVRARLFYSSGVLRALRVAVKDGDLIRETQAVVDAVAFIKEQGIVFLAVGPFVSTHEGASENSNEDIERVVSAFRRIAAETECAIDLTHHAVKNHSGNSEARAGDMNAARGAGAFIGAIRIAYTLSAMSELTAEQQRIPADTAARLVRLDHAKGNYAPRSWQPRWFLIESVPVAGPEGDFGPEDDDDLTDEVDTAPVPVVVDLATLKKATGKDLSAAEDIARIVALHGDVSGVIDNLRAMTRKDLIALLVQAKGMSESHWVGVIRDAVPNRDAKRDPAAVFGGWLWRAGGGAKNTNKSVVISFQGQPQAPEDEGGGDETACNLPAKTGCL